MPEYNDLLRFFNFAKEHNYLVKVCDGCGCQILKRDCGCPTGTSWSWNPNITIDLPNEYVALFKAIYQENLSALAKHGSFNSIHEGYSVIKEEMEELNEEFDAIKNKFETDFWKEGIRKDDMDKIFNEAIQLNAMVIKFIMSWFKEKINGTV